MTEGRKIELMMQSRDENDNAQITKEFVDPQNVGIVIMDVWHYHWCRTWRHRAGSYIPRFNHSLDGARKLGMTLVFSPTGAMRDMHNLPQRKATLALPHHEMPAPQRIAWKPAWIDPRGYGLHFGGCECGYGHQCYCKTWPLGNQHPDLKMAEGDFIGVTKEEVYNIFAERGITHVIITGFATNMCTWAKPAGLKNMLELGFRCVLARDLTEAITRYAEEGFNPADGTQNVIKLIERYIAPTLNMEQLLRSAGAWEGEPILDYVHITPWGRFFGSATAPYPIQVELRCPKVEADEIRYTLDGSEPTLYSPLFEDFILIDESVTLKARAFKDGRPVTRTSVAEYWKLPEEPPLPDVFLSDLKLVSEIVGEVKPNSRAVKKPCRFDRSVDSMPLTNRGHKYIKGIGTQAPSVLIFNIRPEYKRFVALVAVDDETGVWSKPWERWAKYDTSPTSFRVSKISFEVYIDSQCLTKTPTLFHGDIPWGIDVKIPDGSKQIKLIVIDIEDKLTDPHGHGDWLNAGFEMQVSKCNDRSTLLRAD